MQNLKEEAVIFLRIVKAECMDVSDKFHSSAVYGENSNSRFLERPNLKTLISKIRQQFHKYSASDRLWWQGLARILEDKGYIREGDGLVHVCIKYPKPTQLGLRFLHSGETLDAYPEADMLYCQWRRRSRTLASLTGDSVGLILRFVAKDSKEQILVLKKERGSLTGALTYQVQHEQQKQLGFLIVSLGRF
ncbi:hypothetical protein J5N97_018218 [Dioscorea zingiberensis]|uniref:Uncharacterized protein n=1 Tax=Dioscorea zingiberensis TaxID=325984 RepID=A0A9D5CPN8_9LILI|nr:hypothetical protein J5N97_018218 [Dioscorea zingiberensis]